MTTRPKLAVARSSRIGAARLLPVRLSFRTRPNEVAAAIGPGGGPVRDLDRLPLSSPFTSDASHLAQWVADDVLGAAAAASINTRSGAMRLPGIARGVNLIKTQVARNTLVNYRGPAVAAITNGDVVDVLADASWLVQCDDGSSPELRNAAIVDDHIFYGWSLVYRRLSRATGFPLAVDHTNFADWYIDDDNRLIVGGVTIAHSEEKFWALVPGMHEGILSMGVDVLRDGRNLAALIRDRLENPVPDINLEAQPDSEDMTGAEWREFVDAYVANRKINKGVGFTNRFVKAVAMPGRKDADLMIEANNAAVVNQARLLGIHAANLDATAPKASLNYETTSGRNQELVDLDLWGYMLPIAARFSMGDFTPAGQRVAFDLRDLTGTPTTTTENAPALPAPAPAPTEVPA